MKRVIAIFFLFFYTISAVGVQLHLHYCMNKLINVSLWYDKEDACNSCGMKKEKRGCCADKLIKLGVKTKHQKMDATSSIKKIETLFLAFYPEKDFNSNKPCLHEITLNIHAPPEQDGQRLNLIYCTFRI